MKLIDFEWWKSHLFFLIFTLIGSLLLCISLLSEDYTGLMLAFLMFTISIPLRGVEL